MKTRTSSGMPTVKKNWVLKHKKNIVMTAIIILGVMVLLVGYLGPKNPGTSEREACETTCAKKQRFGRLVPSVQSQAKPGGYVGPWKCECY